MSHEQQPIQADNVVSFEKYKRDRQAFLISLSPEVTNVFINYGLLGAIFALVKEAIASAKTFTPKEGVLVQFPTPKDDNAS